MSNKLLILVAIIVIAGAGYLVWQAFDAPVYTESTDIPVDISQDPVQIEDTQAILPPIRLGGNSFFFTPKAQYKLSGMIVSTRPYYSGFMSDLSPYDYATVWGRIPDYMSYIKFNQIIRYCLYSYDLSSPVSKDYIASHMSNNHMIPSTKNIRKALKLGKKNDMVEIDGYLVYVMGNIKKRGTTNWNSSLKRTDTGGGACEIIYVTRLRINDRVYE